MREHHGGGEVVDVNGTVDHEPTPITAPREPDGLLYAAEVGAMKDCRDANVGTAPIIAHAGEAIDDHFGATYGGVGRRRESERECQRRNHRMNGLHDYLPVCGRRDAPARRKDTPKLPL